jgi:hypothetical protein
LEKVGFLRFFEVLRADFSIGPQCTQVQFMAQSNHGKANLCHRQSTSNRALLLPITFGKTQLFQLFFKKIQ